MLSISISSKGASFLLLRDGGQHLGDTEEAEDDALHVTGGGFVDIS